MNYSLYTTVDITHTDQYRIEPGKEELRWKEQNFQTVIQTLGIRANISFTTSPRLINSVGTALGFNTNEIIRIWAFDFYTEREQLFEYNNDPVGYMITDFNGVPYIAGLSESIEQNYNVFVTDGAARNIVFYAKH
jgi:hypothetical protein